MVTKDAFKQGVLSYIDSELMPHLPTASKWGLGAMIVLATPKYDEIYAQLSQSTVLQTLGIFSESGMLDVDCLLDALFTSADKYGNLSLNIPVLGEFTFSKGDIKTLKKHIASCSSPKGVTYNDED